MQEARAEKDSQPTYRGLDKQPALAMAEPLLEKLRGLSILKSTFPLAAAAGLCPTSPFSRSDECSGRVLTPEVSVDSAESHVDHLLRVSIHTMVRYASRSDSSFHLHSRDRVICIIRCSFQFSRKIDSS